MTNDEKQLMKDLFAAFKGLYYRQKVNDDILSRILSGKTVAEINDSRHRFEESDRNITELQLGEIEEKINNL